VTPALLANAKTLWYVTRASGVVALLLLTASVALGVLVAVRWRGRRFPRFAVVVTHRNLTLFSLAFVGVHILTTVTDRYAPISLAAAVVPFASPYRPVWLSLGAIAFDLLLAIVATSLARRLVRPTAWRALHWLAYAAWPVALLHSFGTGSDARTGWFAGLGFACLAAVALAVLARAARGPGLTPVRAASAAVALITPIAVFGWYRSGPLQHGWARRAGTPSALLARHAHARTTGDASLVQVLPPTSFVSALSGTTTEHPAAGGLLDVRIAIRLRGGPRGAARIDLRGVPGGGGVSLTASGVSFVPATTRNVYEGRVVALSGSRVVAAVRDSAGDRLALSFALRIDSASGATTGVVQAEAA